MCQFPSTGPLVIPVPFPFDWSHLSCSAISLENRRPAQEVPSPWMLQSTKDALEQISGGGRGLLFAVQQPDFVVSETQSNEANVPRVGFHNFQQGCGVVGSGSFVEDCVRVETSDFFARGFYVLRRPQPKDIRVLQHQAGRFAKEGIGPDHKNASQVLPLWLQRSFLK